MKGWSEIFQGQLEYFWVDIFWRDKIRRRKMESVLVGFSLDIIVYFVQVFQGFYFYIIIIGFFWRFFQNLDVVVGFLVVYRVVEDCFIVFKFVIDVVNVFVIVEVFFGIVNIYFLLFQCVIVGWEKFFFVVIGLQKYLIEVVCGVVVV